MGSDPPDPISRQSRIGDPLIKVDHLSVRYGDELALDDVSLEVKTGECLVVTGLSGCGKSTLARVLTGLIPNVIPAEISGTVRVAGTAGIGGSMSTVSATSVGVSATSAGAGGMTPPSITLTASTAAAVGSGPTVVMPAGAPSDGSRAAVDSLVASAASGSDSNREFASCDIGGGPSYCSAWEHSRSRAPCGAPFACPPAGPTSRPVCPPTRSVARPGRRRSMIMNGCGRAVPPNTPISLTL